MFQYCNFLLQVCFYRVYEVIILRFDNPLCAQACYLPKENKEILSSIPLFYSFQNPIVHRVALT
jgi:hypothetical protein